MRILSGVCIIWALLLFSCTKTITETVVAVEEFDIDLFYVSTSVGNCNRSGMDLVEALIEDEIQIYKILSQE